MIDAHQHFWNYTNNKEDYVWMTNEYQGLGRDFSPDHLITEMKKCGILGTVAVQAREMNIETDYLLDLAKQYEFILGVVGWLDLCDPNVEESIEHYSSFEKLKGLRMVIHDRPNINFASSEAHKRGVALLKKYNLTYDLLLKPQHIKPALKLVETNPEQSFVIDHIAKPNITKKRMSPWLADLEKISAHKNVYCKLSGMVTEADWKNWKYEDFIPYLDEVLNCFGSSRVMLGSDWPVCTCAADYEQVVGIINKWLQKLSSDEQKAILSENCRDFYHL